MNSLVALSEIITVANQYADRYYRLHVPLLSIDFSECADRIRLIEEHSTQHGPLYDLVLPASEEEKDAWRQLWVWPHRNLLMVRTCDLSELQPWLEIPDAPADLRSILQGAKLPDLVSPRLFGLLNGVWTKGNFTLELDLNRICPLLRHGPDLWKVGHPGGLLGYVKRALDGPESYLLESSSSAEVRKNIDEAVARACQEKTLSEALAWIAVWENDRAVKEALANEASGPPYNTSHGGKWDTCFKIALDRVLETWTDWRPYKEAPHGQVVEVWTRHGDLKLAYLETLYFAIPIKSGGQRGPVWMENSGTRLYVGNDEAGHLDVVRYWRPLRPGPPQ